MELVPLILYYQGSRSFIMIQEIIEIDPFIQYTKIFQSPQGMHFPKVQ